MKQSKIRKKAVDKRTIDMRMYNVGFGDCFLLRIPTSDGERRMLVDCGYHSQGQGKFTDKELVAQIKKDLNGEPLHIVVATHRHQDHISGFGEQALWADVAVEEVWLPFTANPKSVTEEPTLRVWQGLMEAATHLCSAEGKLTPNAISALASNEDIDEQSAAAFMLWNARANAPGIENLLRGFRNTDGRLAKRRFLPDRADYPMSFTTPVLPGATVHVLGPPLDPTMRKNMKVPATWGMEDFLPKAQANSFESPFLEEWRVQPNEMPSHPPFVERTLKTIRLFNEDLLYAAKALDGFINGESLVLVLEIGNARLLLPGDAEVGTWSSILRSPTALEVAASATFVKIGHHGSHNATPLIFLNKHLAEETPAVISTQQGDGKYRNGIPLEDLLSALGVRHMPFVRSDRPPVTAQGIFTPDGESRWIDCSIPC